MAFQLFSRFRHLASSLDRECSQLSSDLENCQTSTENENRSCLLLRETLAEVKNIKSETLKQLEQSRNKMQPLDEILEACKRVLENTREQLESLEDHLDKYGYERPNDPLTSFQDKKMNELDTERKDSTMTIETNKDGTFVVQDQHEQKISSGDDVGKTSSEDEVKLNQSQLGLPHISVSKIANENDKDPVGSPVRPVTFTRMLQAVTTESPQSSLSESAHTPPHAPIPPITTTPLLKQRMTGNELTFNCNIENESPWSGSPVQPVTATPMMKSRKKLATIEDATSPALNSPLPCPPMLGTPGLKVSGNTSTEPLEPDFNFGIESCDMPEAPDITSVQILKPDDFAIPPSSTLKQEDTGFGLPFVVAPVSCEEYNTLPDYITAQFSLQFINRLTAETSRFLSSSRRGSNESPALKEKDLREALHLGHLTKAYMLVLANLSRIKLNGDLMIFL